MKSNIFFSHVLDDPYYIGDGEYLSVVTTGKVRVEGQLERDYNKDAAAKAGLLRVNTNDNTTNFIDFSAHSEPGDRYRCVVVVDDIAYVMRTQKKHVDSIVRLAAVNLKTNEVRMIEEKAVSVHGTETPKTFCGHFNFGRPITVGKKIIYPPLNSGIIIVFDTETNIFVAHDVPDTTASIWSTYVPELNEVVFFPYGNSSNKLLVLSLTTNEHKFVEAPIESTFYNAFSYDGKAIGSPLSMEYREKLYFWIYNGEKVEAVEYNPSTSETTSGMLGFKYGVEKDNILYTHTCGESGYELVKFDIVNQSVESIKTDLPLGAKPVVSDNDIYLFPSIQNPAMDNAPSNVYKIENNHIVEALSLPTNNITYGPINVSDNKVLFVPYRFELNESNYLESMLTIVDLESKISNTIEISLEVE